MDEMELNDQFTPDSSREPARKLACDNCRKKKLKCAWDNDSICNRCAAGKIRCVPHVPQRRRRERKPSTYLSSLEDRLQRMEAAMLKSAAAVPPPKMSSEMTEHREISDELSALRIGDDGSTIFFGAASGSTIISPMGLKWIAEVTGSDDFARVVAQILKPTKIQTNSDPHAWCQITEEERAPLPSARRAGVLLDVYFREGFNLTYPLFDEHDVRERFARDYPVDHKKDPAWYAALNAIFAASEITAGRVESPKSSAESPASLNQPTSKLVDVEGASWFKWFRNAGSKFLELQFMEGSLLACQTVTLLSFALETFPNPYSCLVVATSALRLAQALGLHRSLPYHNLSPRAYELRKNIFWSAFFIERHILVRMGRPSIIHDDDIGIDLPREAGHDGFHGHLRRMAQLGLIQGKIYSSLYSAKAATRTRLERLQLTGLLDEELQRWKVQVPPAIRPGNDIISPGDGTEMFTIVMQLYYYSLLSMIHRLTCRDDYVVNKSDEQVMKQMEGMNINPRVFNGSQLVVNAARSTIKLLDNYSSVINVLEFNSIRTVAFYPLSASMTLFSNVLQEPCHPEALYDVGLMKSVTQFMSGYFADNKDEEYAVFIKTFSEINKLAEEFVLKSQNREKPAANRHVAGIAGDSTKQPTAPRQYTPPNPSDSTLREKSFGTGHFPITTDNTAFDSPIRSDTLSKSPFTAQPTNAQFQAQDPVYSYQPHSIGQSFATIESGQQFSDMSSMSLDSTWLSEDSLMLQPDLFIPDDGAWFFPIANPTPSVEKWDYFGFQAGDSTNAHGHNSMR